MRLIDVSTLELVEHYPPNIPPYAILSHTWGPHEVTFQEFCRSKGKSKAGYRKIMNMVKVARDRGHRFIWVDTCCIDKTDSNELSEAINSMYHWYRDAAVCVAFLEDVPHNAPNKDLFKSRWFTRGWTLQELVAPRHVYFYDANWVCRGPKISFVDEIFARTNIPRRVLNGQAESGGYSLARRMSWAAGRETTRVEDTAYCLLGIFDVSMPLLYGEGRRSFRRLQEEIVKRNSDLTIFAWRSLPTGVPSIELTGAQTIKNGAQPSVTAPMPTLVEPNRVFQPGPSTPGRTSPALSRPTSPSTPSPKEKKDRSVSPSPSHKSNSSQSSLLSPPSLKKIVRSPSSSAVSVASSSTEVGPKKAERTELCLFAHSPEPFSEFASLHPFADDFENFTVTNRGLFVSGSVYLRLVLKPSHDGKMPPSSHYLLLVGSQHGNFVGIYLIKIGPNIFQRDWDAGIAVLKESDVLRMHGFLVIDWYILIDKRPVNTITPETFRQSSIHIPPRGYGNEYIILKDTAPTHLWDVQDRLFVRPKAYAWTRYDMVLVMKCAVALRNTNIEIPKTTDAIPISKRINFVVLCQYRYHQRNPQLVVFLESDYRRETEMLLVRRAPNNSLMWPDLDVTCPYLTKLPDYVMVDVGETDARTGNWRSCWYRISTVLKKEVADFEYASPELWSVYFDIKHVDDYDPEAKVDSQPRSKGEFHADFKAETMLAVNQKKPS
ncbi:hypothetical protein SEUCBS140593_008801 [Sporothrix eucalyptigena]|uniref:Heterokaryon incompatibility domain-containing protein n=1 Tax=Sporothrix eucalyptigena TaxID=1812306 RepID=A0ABP0CPH7_9PEZI